MKGQDNMKLQITIDCDKPAIGEAPGPALSRLLTAYAAAIKDGDVREEYLRDSDGNTVGQVEIIGVEPGSAARVIQFGRMVDDALESLNSVGAKHLSAEAMDMVIAVGDALTRMKRICNGADPAEGPHMDGMDAKLAEQGGGEA